MLDILNAIHAFGLDTVLVAIDELRDACNGDAGQYGALGTLLGDIDKARAIVELLAARCR